MVLLEGVTEMLAVVAPVDQAIAPPEQPLAVRVRLCPFIIVAGLLTEDVILSVGAVTDET